MEAIALLKWLLLAACLSLTASRKTCSPDVWVDIFFMVATDGTVESDNYQRFFDFIGKVTSNFNINDNGTRVAIVSSSPESIGLSGDLDAVNKRLQIVRLHNGQLKFTQAISLIIDYYPGVRLDSHLFGILLTDGSDQTKGKSLFSADDLKYLGMSLFTVSVKRADNTNLVQNVASKPEYSLVTDNYTALVDTADVISDFICQATVCPTVVPIDIIFTVDCSSETLRRCLDQVVTVVETLNLSEEGIRAGYFANDRTPIVPSGNKTSVIQTFRTTTLGARTEDYKSYRILQSVQIRTIFTPIERPTARRVLVYVTNDKSPYITSDLQYAQLAKNFGSIIFTIAGTPEADQNQLNGIATKPEYNLSSGNFSTLNEVLGTLKPRGCRVPN